MGQVDLEIPAGDQLIYLAPYARGPAPGPEWSAVGDGTIVASRQRAWTIGPDGSEPRQISCCAATERIVSGSVDLSGTPWVILSDGTPVTESGYRPPIGKAIRALNANITYPGEKTARLRSVIGWAVAMLDDHTAVVATRSLGRGVNEPPQHANDVMIWKVQTGKDPTLLAGVPSGQLRFFWAPKSLYERSGVDPRQVELDTVQAIVPLSPTEFVLTMWMPSVPDNYLTIGLLNGGNLRELDRITRTGPRLLQMVRQDDDTVDYTSQSTDHGTVSTEAHIWGTSAPPWRANDWAFTDRTGNRVQATQGSTKLTVSWIDR